jgi:hypothetical protein
MTSAGLRRWLRIVNPYMPDAELRPVAMRKFDIMKYTVIPRADTIDALDASPLPSGDYGLFRPFVLICDSCYFLEPFAAVDHPRDWGGNTQPLTLSSVNSFEDYIKLHQSKPKLGAKLELVMCTTYASLSYIYKRISVYVPAFGGANRSSA